ncbi:hypothetical protein PHYSODRAFT_300822 [Phytophthora sojae]|uniref:RxLR effector protein n=1 Tax=Phytophthora sojae (strain P6497) TaxID=1094619 RepID=G4ZFJ3_PHYSP|nr:hypothetical protein PHYSODRAFT_300822 [Phytophthora sojae]EGZ17930.1 hypothetical protein PHYSODRAFT_300822 [Phytophthora sojae]|eukprot:XP_009526988.1 hypothetical protein PHYSODRAFT_300822 [Phytophthora sojae]
MQLLLVRLIFSSSVAFGEWEQLTIDDTPKKNKLIAQRVREGSVVGGSGGTKFSVREEGRDCMYYGRGSAWGLESILLLQGATASSTLVGFESKLELATFRCHSFRKRLRLPSMPPPTPPPQNKRPRQCHTRANVHRCSAASQALIVASSASADQTMTKTTAANQRLMLAALVSEQGAAADITAIVPAQLDKSPKRKTSLSKRRISQVPTSEANGEEREASAVTLVVATAPTQKAKTKQRPTSAGQSAALAIQTTTSTSVAAAAATENGVAASLAPADQTANGPKDQIQATNNT